MPATPPNYVAVGQIRPSRFVTLVDDFAVEEADANEIICGIAMEGTRTAPISDVVTTNIAAESGDSLQVYGDGEECLLECGDTVVAGNRLKSDADGKGVPMATTGTTIQHYGAQALQDGAASELIRVFIRIGSERPALA